MLIDVDVVDGGGISRATKNDEGYNGGGRRPSPPRTTVVDDDVATHWHHRTHHRARSSPPPSALSVDPPDDGGGGARIVVASADDRAIRRERSRREGCGGRGGGARWIAFIVFSGGVGAGAGAGRGENGGGKIGTRDVVEDDRPHTRCDLLSSLLSSSGGRDDVPSSSRCMGTMAAEQLRGRDPPRRGRRRGRRARHRRVGGRSRNPSQSSRQEEWGGGGVLLGIPLMNTQQSNCVGDCRRGGGIGGPTRSRGRGTENNDGNV